MSWVLFSNFTTKRVITKTEVILRKSRSTLPIIRNCGKLLVKGRERSGTSGSHNIVALVHKHSPVDTRILYGWRQHGPRQNSTDANSLELSPDREPRAERRTTKKPERVHTNIALAPRPDDYGCMMYIRHQVAGEYANQHRAWRG